MEREKVNFEHLFDWCQQRVEEVKDSFWSSSLFVPSSDTVFFAGLPLACFPTDHRCRCAYHYSSNSSSSIVGGKRLPPLQLAGR